MPDAVPAKQETSATIPYTKINITAIEGTQWYSGIKHILHLPGGQRIITYSWYGSFRVWDLETGVQVGEEWEHEEIGMDVIALSPDSKTVASGSQNGAVILWNIDTGKVIKKWTGNTNPVKSVCWSSDGGRVMSGSQDGTFRVWDIESGRIILGQLKFKARQSVLAFCYSPDFKMIATGGSSLKVWDANTGELLTTIIKLRFVTCLVWTSDGKTLIAAGIGIGKFDTATWSETALELEEPHVSLNSILLSPNDRILASTSLSNKIAQLWNLETNQPIKPSLHHEFKDNVKCAAFSADGMFLLTASWGIDDPIYKWDLSGIIKEAHLLSDNVDATRQPAPKIKVARRRRIPTGFFHDARRADLSTSRTQFHGQHHSSTPLRQRTFVSFWRRRFNRHGATERGAQSWSSPFSWTRNLVSGMVPRQDAQDMESRELPIVEVPCTAGKPRNYHARRKKPAASSSQRVHAHLSQQPPPTATASTLPAVAGAAGTTGAITRPHIPITGWRVRLLTWVCCIPIQNAN